MGEGLEQLLKDGLEQTLNRVIDWVKYEEAKNGALVTLDGVGVGVVLQWLSSPEVSVALARCLKGSLAALLASLLVALSSFYPVVKGKWLHRYFAWRRGRLAENTELGSNILFFGDIAGKEPEAYLDDFQSAVQVPHEMELAYAEEIVTNAEIALLKLRMFQAAFVVSVLGFIVICGAAVVYSFRK
jgi:hypothetical protein